MTKAEKPDKSAIDDRFLFRKFMSQPKYALSIKQPWAALLVSGLKSIEIRRWTSSIRGRVYIHAARVPDERDEAWAWVTPEIEELTKLVGGVIGSAELHQCSLYRTPQAFALDADKHLNDPSWFQPPLMYGMHFRDPKTEEFIRCRGQVKFFQVEASE